jgi:cell division septation protein DedD
MVTAAQSMAPVISRMEPVGRTLVTKGIKEPPPPPPKTPAQEKPKPRLPAPPLSPTQSPSPPVSGEAVILEPPGPRKYTVLLGAFGKQENALSLKSRIEAAGFPVAISEVTEKNKLWFRVQSGAFDDKVSAEAYSRELKQRKLVDRPYVKPL